MSWICIKSSELPERFIKGNDLGQPVATFSINEKQEDGNYKSKTFTLKPATFDYSSIVNAIVSSEYPDDKMQAIVNNYLLDNTNEDTNKEFSDMQAFRKKAKQWAKDLITYVEENKLWTT